MRLKRSEESEWMKYINANLIKELMKQSIALQGNCEYALWLQTVENYVDNLPSIDIVRCKECVHRKKNGFCLEHNRYEKNDNGYCSYGEREGE